MSYSWEQNSWVYLSLQSLFPDVITNGIDQQICFYWGRSRHIRIARVCNNLVEIIGPWGYREWDIRILFKKKTLLLRQVHSFLSRLNNFLFGIFVEPCEEKLKAECLSEAWWNWKSNRFGKLIFLKIFSCYILTFLELRLSL